MNQRQPTTPQVPSPTYQPTSQKSQNKSKKGLIILIIALVVVLGGAAAYYFLIYNQEDTNQNFVNSVIVNQANNAETNNSESKEFIYESQCSNAKTGTVIGSVKLVVPEGAITKDVEVSGVTFQSEVGCATVFSPQDFIFTEPATLISVYTEEGQESMLAPGIVYEEDDLIMTYWDSENHRYVEVESVYNKAEKSLTSQINKFYSGEFSIMPNDVLLELNNTDMININTKFKRNIDRNDNDSDGIPNGVESWYGTNLNSADSDDDGYEDYAEIDNCYDPLGTGIIDQERVGYFCANSGFFRSFSSNGLLNTVDTTLDECTRWAPVAKKMIIHRIEGKSLYESFMEVSNDPEFIKLCDEEINSEKKSSLLNPNQEEDDTICFWHLQQGYGVCDISKYINM